VKRFFYSEQKGALNQPFAKPHPEISPENRGPATGTFGTEIKGRPYHTAISVLQMPERRLSIDNQNVSRYLEWQLKHGPHPASEERG
jgi:hypothetical protein